MSDAPNARRTRLVVATLFFGIPLTLLGPAGCSIGVMPLAVQKEHVQRHELLLGKLTPTAFLETWGPPTYLYEATTRFYVLTNGQYVPQFRVPLGEAPELWDSTILSGYGRFFGYPEQGELLGFVDDRLVYREPLPPAELHAIGKAWAGERKFRTTIERDLLKGR